MTMRTHPALALLLTFLAPALAMAQQEPTRGVADSPLLWYWLVVLVVATVAFAVVSFRLSRRRQPPSGRGTA
jgi:hypothetical protein